MLTNTLRRSLAQSAVAGPSAASSSLARGFATSSVARLATPAESKPAQMKEFKIYRWVSTRAAAGVAR